MIKYEHEYTGDRKRAHVMLGHYTKAGYRVVEVDGQPWNGGDPFEEGDPREIVMSTKGFGLPARHLLIVVVVALAIASLWYEVDPDRRILLVALAPLANLFYAVSSYVVERRAVIRVEE